LAIREKSLGPEHPDTATSLNNLALFYRSMGDYTAALPLYQHALAISEKAHGPDHPRTATSLNNLAVLLDDSMGAYVLVEPLYQRALAIREKALGPNHPDTATSLNNLAGMYDAISDYAQAKPLHQRALAISEKTLGPDHPNTATSLNNLAAMYDAMGDYAQAKPLYQRALNIYEKALGPDHSNTAGSLKNLALLHWAQGHWQQAFDGLQRSTKISAGNARQILALGDEARKHAFTQTLIGETDIVVTFSLATRSKVANAESLAAEVLMQRKGQVLDVLANSLVAVRKSLAPQDQQLFSQWRDVTNQYATLVFRRPEQMPAEKIRERLAKLKAQANILEAELSTRSAQFRHEVEPVTLHGVQQTIPAGATLIEWFRYRPFDPKAKDEASHWGKPRYVAYVLKSRGKPAAVDVGEAAPIETAIGDLLVALTEQHATVAEIGRELDERLMQPLRPHLGGAERLLISPDSQLNLLPFGVLTDAQGRYLMQSAEITYLTSGRDLLRLTDTVANRQAPVIFANPDYGPLMKVDTGRAANANNRRSADMLDGMQQFAPLKGTEQEARALKGVLRLKAEQILTGAMASEAAIKQLKNPRILHLAAHGFFLEGQHADAPSTLGHTFGSDTEQLPGGENPLLRSGLALAGANQLRSGDDDGILTALEVSGLNLKGTELAVLSACETGLGQVQNGEGVYGLRRALVLAGVQSQVVSLWKVSDTATRDLMVDYYTRLTKGVRSSQALHEAQLAMMKNPARAHPFYWAAFVAIGITGPLGK